MGMRRAAREKRTSEEGENERKMRKKHVLRNGKKKKEGRHVTKNGAQILTRAARLHLASAHFVSFHLTTQPRRFLIPLQYVPRGSSVSVASDRKFVSCKDNVYEANRKI